MSKFKIVGINFDHMHMGDLLRKAKQHPDVEIVGVSDEQPDRVLPVLKQIGLDESLFVSDYRKLMEDTKPDLAILCPATAEHAIWTEKSRHLVRISLSKNHSLRHCLMRIE